MRLVLCIPPDSPPSRRFPLPDPCCCATTPTRPPPLDRREAPPAGLTPPCVLLHPHAGAAPHPPPPVRQHPLSLPLWLWSPCRSFTRPLPLSPFPFYLIVAGIASLLSLPSRPMSHWCLRSAPDFMAIETTAHEASSLLPPAASDVEKARRGFLAFMTKVTQYEELVDEGKRFLVKFHQQIERLQRPKLLMESGAVSELVKSNYTDRMKSYLEAGCHLQHQSIRNINQLHSCEEKLEDHINKVKGLIEDLQSLIEDVYITTPTASLAVLSATKDFHGDDSLTDYSCEDEHQPGDQLDTVVSYSSVMLLVLNMLKLDCTMQEKIVKALCLKTSSSDLEGYCLMWNLRPYIDDNVMQLAWKFVS